MFKLDHRIDTAWDIFWDPDTGSNQSGYSFGDTGWRFPAMLLAEAVMGLSPLVEDLGVRVAVPLSHVDIASLITFGEWEPYSGRLLPETSYYLADSGTESLLYPWHREAIDDAAFYATRLQLPITYTIFSGRSLINQKAGGESKIYDLLVVEASAMGDNFSVTGIDGTPGATLASDLVESVIDSINRTVV
jgi:hypothetical protein